MHHLAEFDHYGTRDVYKRQTLPIEPLTKIGGFFRSKNLICPMRIPDGLRAIIYGDKTGSSIQNPTPLNKRLTQK